MLRPSLLVVLGWWSVSPLAVRAQSSKPTPPAPVATQALDRGPQLTRQQIKDLKTRLREFQSAEAAEARAEHVQAMLAMGPRAAEKLLVIVEGELRTREQQYAQSLAPKIREAYRQRLRTLSDEQVLHVQRTRRLWKNYVLHGGSHPEFQRAFLAPVWKMAEDLLVQVKDIEDPGLEEQRRILAECAGYRQACHALLKIDPDPTRTKLSPTNLPYPPLDQPPTFLDSLRHLERTLVLAHSVAPAGARPVLMANDAAAREIDVQEAEFVMFGNEVRMLTGTIAWRVDPLANAAVRDHSNDRKEGRASGHISSIPEKRGFTMRMKRFGADFYNSEGAGGGRDGRGYIHGLSYSGSGHGGPLYSLKRNCVGVGRRGGVYTSVYRTDAAIVHDCQATRNELFMPPGLGRSDVRHGTLQSAYRALQAGAFGTAKALLEKIEPRTDDDRMLLRFFDAAVHVEMDWFFEGLAAVQRSGDVFELQHRLKRGRHAFKGLADFESRAQPYQSHLQNEVLASDLQAGRYFHQIFAAGYEPEQLKSAVSQFAKRFAGTLYVQAAQAAMADEKGNRFAFFLKKNPELGQYDYPSVLHDQR